MNDLRIEPIGKVSTEVTEITSSQMEDTTAISELFIYKKYEECLDGIEGYSHIIVCYWAHLVSESERKMKKVHPKGNRDLPEKGIFATRSQARPNPICLTTVELLKRENNILLVKGLDALNNSPILDIKPHVVHFDAPSNPSLPEWVKKLGDFPANKKMKK